MVVLYAYVKSNLTEEFIETNCAANGNRYMKYGSLKVIMLPPIEYYD